ncbi:FAD/NAD(P)-binding domain-containing protein [Schizophyllum commune Loenen D]|nr:FAD/NAD(P)-binding domain-containing protein [Schizophyllum commune Loenen D]
MDRDANGAALPQGRQVPSEARKDSAFELGDFAIDDPRPMKVVVIGAGYSGIIAGIRFRQYIQNLDLTIYEANAGVGGTWYSNKYPGLACDVTSHAYQPTFAPNPEWSKFYVSGPEIRAHVDCIVDHWKLRPFIKLRHRLVRAEWDDDKGKWLLTIRVEPEREDVNEGQADDEEAVEIHDTADVLFTGFGLLSRWSWPEIEGLHTFKGPVIHSAHWETPDGGDTWEESVRNWGDKRVGVIGLGSSAIQIVTALQPRVGKLVNLARGKTWISNAFASSTLQALAGTNDCGNYEFTEADKERLRNPEEYLNFRRELESAISVAWTAKIRGSEAHVAGIRELQEVTKRKLAKKPWIADSLIPDFSPGCRRLTPCPGYLEALCEDNVDFVSSPIARVTKYGLITQNGQQIDLDILICATGYDSSCHPGVPIIGKGGIDLKDKYTPYPKTYLSMAVDGFPNWFQALGPNSATGSGSVMNTIESQVMYAVKATEKLQLERLKSMDAKKEAVDDFDAYIEALFPKTVYSEHCKSWYKNRNTDGRIWGLWPGSTLHMLRTLERPRWEDYTYEPLEKTTCNRLFWMGNGATVSDMDPIGHKAFYLDNIDVPPVPK